MYKIIICFFLSIIVFSCDSSTYQAEQIIETFEDGQIKIKKVFPTESDTVNCIFYEYFPNGQISRTGPMKDSIVHGYWEYFYENGQIKQKGDYSIDDRLNKGCWTYSYWLPLMNERGEILPEGQPSCSVAWMERESHNIHVCKEGYWETFYENGNLSTKCTYENGWIVGPFEEYFENGQLKLLAEFDKQNRTGVWEYYYDNGQKKKEVAYKEGEEVILNFWLSNGDHTLQDGNGAVYEVTDDRDSIVQEFSDYKLHGRYLVYQLSMGKYKRYEIDTETHYRKGLEHGVRKYYNVAGYTDEERLSTTMELKDGKRHGYWIQYFHGDTTALSYFVDDLEHRTSVRYYNANGNLEMSESWKMGVRHGPRKYYNYEGDPDQFQYFWEDQYVGNEEFENGKIVTTYIPSGDTLKFNKVKKEFN